MTNNLTFNDKILELDPEGHQLNPLTKQKYSENYKRLASAWSTYPAYSRASDILSSIANFPLTILVSETGSGKTVLVPKLALHYTDYRGKIAVTLPKRAVTLSAAEFSADTLDVTLGKEIGLVYKGSDKKFLNSDNRMVYMTDGTLIMKFINDPDLMEYQIVIIDEAHERTGSATRV